MRSIQAEGRALSALVVLALAMLSGTHVWAQNLRAMPSDPAGMAPAPGAGSTSGTPIGSPKPIMTCCEEPRLMTVSGDGQQMVTNTITQVALSIRVSASIPVDTTPAIDVNVQPQPVAATATASSTGGSSSSATASASQLPTTPTTKQLDAMANSVMQNATNRTANVLALLQATSASRLQTQGVSLQPTSVWVPKLSQSVNNGYTASNSISFRIASSAMGTLLADVMRLGATNIDSVSHTASDNDLETGRRAAIRMATRRALARAQLAAAAIMSKPVLDIKNVQISASGASAPQPVAQPVMFALATVRTPAPAAPAPVSTDVAGQTEIDASVSLQVQITDYASVTAIAASDLS